MSTSEKYAAEIIKQVRGGANLSAVVRLLQDFDEQNWIPVSTGVLPEYEECEPCIVLTKSEHGVTAGNFTKYDYGHGKGHSWSAFLRPSTYEPEDFSIDGVTHWRPFPKFSECSLDLLNTPTMMPFGEAPIGARFRYPGSKKVWVKLNSYPEGPHHSGRGLICDWRGYGKGFQQFCAFCDEDSGITFDTEVELVD
jgi:hypothetical protein